MKIIPKNSKTAVIISLLVLACVAAVSIPAVLKEASFAAEPKTKLSAEELKIKKDRVAAGKLYYDSKKYDAAIKEWEEALSIDPNDAKIRKYIKTAKRKLDAVNKKSKPTVRKSEPPKIETKKEEPVPVDKTISKKIDTEKARELKEFEDRIEAIIAGEEIRKKEFKKEVGLISVTAPSKEVVGTLRIDDCVKIAAANHIPLQVAEKSITLAKMRVFEARRNMLPSATIAWENSSGEIYGRKYYGRKQSIEGQQPVFHGGELYFTMKQAETSLEITKNDYRRVRNELVLQVKKAYYTLAKTKENLKIQQALAQEAERISEMVKKEYDAGITSKLEFLNVSSQASQIRYQFVSANGDISIADLILKQTMNMDYREAIEIEPIPEFKVIEVDFEDALRLAFINRPEVKANSLMVDYYRYGRSVARAKGWIKIDIMGQWGLAKEQYTVADSAYVADANFTALQLDSDQKIKPQWYAGVKASMPFWGSTGEYSWTKEDWVPVVSAFHGTEAMTNAAKFKILDNLGYYSTKQLAEIDLDKARQELNKMKQDVTLEVKEGCFNYEKALIQLNTASNKVKYQSTDVELIKLKREMDEVPDSNVMESMIKLAQEKFGYMQALTDCHVSVASLNKAVGIEDYFGSNPEEKKVETYSIKSSSEPFGFFKNIFGFGKKKEKSKDKLSKYYIEKK